MNLPPAREPGRFELSGDISRRRLVQFGGLAGAGLVAGVPMLTGCGGSQPARRVGGKPPSTPTGTLRVANNGEPSTLDPASAELAFDAGIVLNNIYEGLLSYREGSFELVPMLAQSFESSADAREWVFRLKKGVKFHDGEPLTSTAVKASFEYYAKAPLDPTGAKSILQVAKFDDSDPLVFRATTEAPCPDLARIATRVQIISPRLVRSGVEAINKTPIGTGPFRFVSYKTAESVVLEANPDYRGPGPYLKRLEFPIIPDPDSRLSALRSGSVDLVLQIPPATASQLRADPSVVVTAKEIWWSTKLLMFTRTPPLDNLSVRRALAHAIDRQALVDSIMQGFGEVDDSWTAPSVYGYEKPKTTYPYDPERARQLLAESGVPTPIEITFARSESADGTASRITQAIAAMAEKVGFATTVKPLQATKWVKYLAHPKEPRTWHALVASYGFPDGSGAHLNHVYDKIVEGVHQVFDPTLADLNKGVLANPDGPKRLDLLAKVAERVAELAPLATLFTNKQIDAHKTTVQGYVTANYGVFPDYRTVYIAS